LRKYRSNTNDRFLLQANAPAANPTRKSKLASLTQSALVKKLTPAEPPFQNTYAYCGLSVSLSVLAIMLWTMFLRWRYRPFKQANNHLPRDIDAERLDPAGNRRTGRDDCA